MAALDRVRALEAFRGYVEPYGEDSERIALKVAHTYRVADLCDRIARSRAWGPLEVDLAWLAGLLHDIGRFEQLRVWDTFRDADSASHAALGCAVLRGDGADSVPSNVPAPADAVRVAHPAPPAAGSGALESFISGRDHDDAIMAAVGQHSALAVDGSLDARVRALCDVVRDADKIDILRVNCENTPYTVLGLSDAEFLQSEISDAAMAAFRERRCLSRDERREPADMLVGMVAFVFELVYPQSRQIVLEQGFLSRLLERPLGLARPFARPETRERWREVSMGALRAV